MLIELVIQGMSCEHCCHAIRKALQEAGLEAKEVQIGRAVIETKEYDLAKLKAAIAEAGYELLSLNDAT